MVVWCGWGGCFVPAAQIEGQTRYLGISAGDANRGTDTILGQTNVGGLITGGGSETKCQTRYFGMGVVLAAQIW
jgi:hypothetical protein